MYEPWFFDFRSRIGLCLSLEEWLREDIGVVELYISIFDLEDIGAIELYKNCT
jgi:hypothetical protein